MKKLNFETIIKILLPLACIALAILLITSCSDNDDIITPEPEPTVTTNPAKYITDESKLAMLYSMRDLDGTGRLYEINYTEDYKLDQVIAAQKLDQRELFGYIGGILFDNVSSQGAKVNFGSGCSAFATNDPNNGNSLMGRNYDFRHIFVQGTDTTYKETSAILVHTAPAGGKKSISMVDGLNLNYGKGFYTDGTSDLSLLMGLPYAALDGINEDGFAIGILALREMQTSQNTGRPKIGCTVAIRMLLDRASDVESAIQMLNNYDMDMTGQGSSNYHFFMADAKGKYAIVEYTFDKSKGETTPHVSSYLKDNDTLRCVTNFYVDPIMAGTNDGWGSDHGKDRYWKLRKDLAANNYELNYNQAWQLLKDVAQPPTKDFTSQTQWSALFNLTERTMRLSILREYGKEYNFKVE